MEVHMNTREILREMCMAITSNQNVRSAEQLACICWRQRCTWDGQPLNSSLRSKVIGATRCRYARLVVCHLSGTAERPKEDLSSPCALNRVRAGLILP